MEIASKTPLHRTRSSRVYTYQLLAALPLGILVGLLLRRLGPQGISAAQALGQIGQLWLNALRMTLIPLVFCLMTAGVASIARTTSGGRVVRIAVSVFLGLLLVGSVLGALVALGLMALWPLAQVHATAPAAAAVPPSLLGEFVSLVPSNPVGSAAEGAIAPVIVFAAFLGAAIVRIKSEWATLLLDVFNGLAAAMLRIIDWILRLAPAGIFFLILQTIAAVGSDAAKGLLQYGILAAIIPAVGLVIAESIGLVSGVGAKRFARAALPSQTLAATTTSSSACLPPLLEAAAALHLPEEIVSAILPLAVATFRFGNVVAGVSSGLLGAALFGIHPSLVQTIAAIGIGVLTNIGSVGLPGSAVVFAAWGAHLPRARRAARSVDPLHCDHQRAGHLHHHHERYCRPCRDLAHRNTVAQTPIAARRRAGMSTAADFRRIALSFPDVAEHEHGGQPAFTVGGRRFAGLASVAHGYGNLTLTPEVQVEFVADAPGVFLPIAGGFGRMGHTHIILAAADKDTLHDALQTAYKLRVAKNSPTSRSKSRKSR